MCQVWSAIELLVGKASLDLKLAPHIIEDISRPTPAKLRTLLAIAKSGKCSRSPPNEATCPSRPRSSLAEEIRQDGLDVPCRWVPDE